MHGHWPLMKRKPAITVDAEVVVGAGSDSDNGKGADVQIMVERKTGCSPRERTVSVHMN
jgi:hypothetical protein